MKLPNFNFLAFRLTSDVRPLTSVPHSSLVTRHFSLARTLAFSMLLLAFAISVAFGQSQKIRSEFDKDEWWAQKAAISFSKYQFTLRSTSSELAAESALRIDGGPRLTVRNGKIDKPSAILAGVTYYYQGGALNTASNWNTARNGSGTNAANFTGGDTFVIQNGQSPTLGGAWAIGGTGSGLLIETGGTMTTGANNPTLTLSMQSGATYIMNTSTYGNLSTGTIDANSTFNYQSTMAGIFRTTLTYGNLLWNYTGGADTPGDVTTLGSITNNTGGSRELRVATGSTSRTWNIGADVANNASSVLNLNNGSATAIANIGGGLSNSGSIIKSGTGSATINFNGTGSSNVVWGTNTNNFNVNIGSATSTKTINMSDSLNNGTGTVGVFGTLNLGNGSKLNGTGTITVNSTGTLAFTGTTGTDRINNAAPMALAGGTFGKGNLSEGTASAVGIGALTLTASGSHIDFGTGTVGVLTFASFTPGVNVLSIDNWTGTANMVGGVGTDRLIFNADQTLNLASFSFAGYAPGAVEFALGGGFFEVTPLTPVPEPATWIGGALAVGVIGWSLLKSGKLKREKADER